jgi:hypothetical protein
MATPERTNVENLAVWVGGQLKGARTYAEQVAATAADGAVNRVLGGVGAAYDTLLEIQQAMAADESTVQGVLTALGKRVRVDAAQTLTAGEQAQARTNIGALGTADLGPEVDYVAAATAAMNS